MTNIFGKHDDNTLAQFRDVESRAIKAALMADGHVGFIQPIGAITAYDDMVSIMGVIRRGGDVDEAPHVYRRLPDVLQDQGRLLRSNTV